MDEWKDESPEVRGRAVRMGLQRRGEYSRAWRAHRCWRRVPILAFAAVVALLLAMGQFPWLQGFQPVLPLVWGVCVACFLVSNVMLATFRCPRCGGRFHGGLMGSGRFSLRPSLGQCCGHCGLGLYAER